MDKDPRLSLIVPGSLIQGFLPEGWRKLARSHGGPGTQQRFDTVSELLQLILIHFEERRMPTENMKVA